MYNENKFPNELKIVDITLVFETQNPLDKTNYRPISILPTVSKIFERILFNQLLRFSHKSLSPLLCGFKQGYSAQYALTKLPPNGKCFLIRLTGLFKHY